MKRTSFFVNFGEMILKKYYRNCSIDRFPTTLPDTQKIFDELMKAISYQIYKNAYLENFDISDNLFTKSGIGHVTLFKF